MSTTGKLLKESRLKANLTQDELAGNLGFDSAQHISNMERGTSAVTIKHIPDICKQTKSSKRVFMNALVTDYRNKLQTQLKIRKA